MVEEVYLGESSRSVVTRAREHQNDYKLAMRKVATGQGGGEAYTGSRSANLGRRRRRKRRRYEAEWLITL